MSARTLHLTGSDGDAGSMWLPRSRCDTRCLPADARTGPAGVALAAVRITTVVTVLLVAVVLCPLTALSPPAWRRVTWRLLARTLLAVLGVRQEVRGGLPRRAALVVANHVSWLDALVLLAYLPVRLVAKGQVRRWPVIGRLTTATGAVFVDRRRPRTLPETVARVSAELRAGHWVAVFPEGTTWCGRATGRFRPAMFQAAIDAGVPVVPVGLSYRAPDGRDTTLAAYIGDDLLVVSLLRVARARGLRAEVRVSPALYPDSGASRDVLARSAHAAIQPECPRGID